MLYRSTTYTAGIQQTTKLWKILSRLTLSTCTVCVHSWAVLCVLLSLTLRLSSFVCFSLHTQLIQCTSGRETARNKSHKSYHLPALERDGSSRVDSHKATRASRHDSHNTNGKCSTRQPQRIHAWNVKFNENVESLLLSIVENSIVRVVSWRHTENAFHCACHGNLINSIHIFFVHFSADTPR